MSEQEPASNPSLQAPQTKYAKCPGFYLIAIVSVILLLGSGIVLSGMYLKQYNSDYDYIYKQYEYICIALTAIYSACFGIYVLARPAVSAGAGKPWHLNLIFGVNFFIAATLFFGELAKDDEEKATNAAIYGFIGALVFTLLVRLVLGMNDDGRCIFFRAMKPWRIVAAEEAPAEPPAEPTKYIRQIGYYIGAVATLIMCAYSAYIFLYLFDDLEMKKFCLAFAFVLLASLIFNVLMKPQLTAGKGCPNQLNWVFLCNFFVIVAYALDLDIYGFLYAPASFLVTIPTRLIWGLEDEGSLLSALKPWKFAAKEVDVEFAVAVDVDADVDVDVDIDTDTDAAVAIEEPEVPEVVAS
jgi:hypothetical protein